MSKTIGDVILNVSNISLAFGGVKALTFEDGRTGSVSATLKIGDAQIFVPVKAAA